MSAQAVPQGRWVPVTERLPPEGEEVFVTGMHVPPDTGNPRSRLCVCMFGNPAGRPHFESNEWRGMCGVTHWWEVTDGADAAGDI